MRHLLIALSMLAFLVTPAHAQISVGIGVPGIDIGINVPLYPDLVPVPGYPVYYDPRADSNYFFYDGMYWVYGGDHWYASSWYNGPWQTVGPQDVPLFVLRIPVRYYRQPPAYFRGWSADAPPRWGEHWGRGWEARRAGWDRWDHRSAPRAAPLPAYQGRFSGDRYPREVEQQQRIRSENYRYRPRAAVTRVQAQPHGGAGPMRTEVRPPAPGTPRGPMQRQQLQPSPERGPQQHQGPGPSSAMKEPQSPGPMHREQPASSARQQRPRDQSQKEEGNGRGEGRGQDHR